MNRRNRLALGSLAAVVAAAVVLFIVSRGESPDVESVNRIRVGMTIEEVRALMGSRPSSTYDGRWTGEGWQLRHGEIIIWYSDRRVTQVAYEARRPFWEPWWNWLRYGPVRE